MTTEAAEMARAEPAEGSDPVEVDVAQVAEREPERRPSFLRELVVLVITALLIAVGVKTVVAQAFYIPSGSMLPQLQVGDRIVVSKLAYHLHDPHRGDIVVFDAPIGPNAKAKTTDALPLRIVRGLLQSVGVAAPSTDEFVKRVIGLPGETVEGHGGHVFVDNRELVEPYLPPGTISGDFAPVVVPKGRLWVMGDNRQNSADSRVFGAISKNLVVGRAFVRIWPISDFKTL